MPTCYWLVGEPERTAVSRLESAGGEAWAEAEVDPTWSLQRTPAMRRSVTWRCLPDRRAAGVRRGGRDPNGGQLPAAHFAWHLAGGDDPVGRWVEDRPRAVPGNGVRR